MYKWLCCSQRIKYSERKVNFIYINFTFDISLGFLRGEGMSRARQGYDDIPRKDTAVSGRSAVWDRIVGWAVHSSKPDKNSHQAKLSDEG